MSSSFKSLERPEYSKTAFVHDICLSRSHQGRFYIIMRTCQPKTTLNLMLDPTLNRYCRDAAREIICYPGLGHHMIIAGVDLSIGKLVKKIFRKILNFTKANWEKFTLELESIFEITEFCKIGESVDKALARYSNIIFGTAKKMDT
ncbi:hypothetical protein NPIL_486291 [Nephila pilipes]|uniref:Uncharacterized protein n=1 Tax=Nephila pilipes TaxID=299642 RepID=A0A8X6UI46_NEPPI|nr:hypothetical protein NPIL_486291 [Nephila pilipes]